jgi:large subunit ribosomal protein L13
MHTIDAQGKKLGRVASEAAVLLMGKNTPEFVRNAIPEVTVTIENASKLDLSEARLAETSRTYSGYPGGLKETSRAKLIEKKGFGEALRKAVYGMLPANKLRARMMKNLVISE